MKKTWKVLLISASLLSVFSVSVFAEKIVLTTELQDTQPKFIKNSDGNFSGLCIELIRLIEKNSNYQFSYPKDFVAIQRIEANLKNAAIDVHFGLNKTPSRENTLIFGAPLYKVKFVILANVNDEIKIQTIDELKKIANADSVLTIGGTAVNDFVTKQLGIKVDNGSNSINNNLQKLLNGRGRLLIYTDLGLSYEMNNNPNYIGKFKILPLVLQESDQWLLFSQKVPGKYRTEIVETIKNLKNSGEWDKILTKYLRAK